MASVEEVRKKLVSYLLSNNYKNIDINRSSGVISAMRKKSFFHKSHYLWLVVRWESDNSTVVELKLNPQTGKKTGSDEIKELKLRSKIFFFVAGSRSC